MNPNLKQLGIHEKEFDQLRQTTRPLVYPFAAYCLRWANFDADVECGA